VVRGYEGVAALWSSWRDSGSHMLQTGRVHVVVAELRPLAARRRRSSDIDDGAGH